MKMLLSKFFLLVGLIAIGSAEFAKGAEVKPVVRAVKGTVTNDQGKPLKAGDSLSAGEKITTTHGSGILIEPVPGQIFFVAEDSKVRIEEAKLISDGKSVALREFRGYLNEGLAHSSINGEKAGGSSHKVSTKYGLLTASGTSWGSWVGLGWLRSAVFAGHVTFSSQSLPEGVILEPGMVLLLSIDATGATVIDVVNLRVGTVTHYATGAAPVVGRATIDQVNLARLVMEKQIAAFLGTGTGGEKRAFALLLVQEINRTLADFNLAPIQQLTDWIWPPITDAHGITFRDTVLFPGAKPPGGGGAGGPAAAGGGAVVSPEAP